MEDAFKEAEEPELEMMAVKVKHPMPLDLPMFTSELIDLLLSENKRVLPSAVVLVTEGYAVTYVPFLVENLEDAVSVLELLQEAACSEMEVSIVSE